ncbi:MAG: MarR family transcriptional regulator [Candidatus Aenigmarchaeota archaeon]|nr:MarR family transcriptional regulator [Candidatus Aenigmarchaeota archaeon]
MISLPAGIPGRTGHAIIILSLILLAVLYSLTSEIVNMGKELHKNCPLPPGMCIFTRSIPVESALGLIAVLSLLFLGLNIIIQARRTKSVSLQSSRKLTKAAESLAGDEKLVFEAIAADDGFAFQNELATKLGMSKVRITRALDKLEGRGLIERKRRGITNAVILKHE